MTTIVYDHKNKQIAVDGRICRSDTISSDEFVKFKEHDGKMWFICGVAADFDLLTKWFSGGEKPELVPECEAIVADDRKVYSYFVAEHGAPNRLEISFNEAIGSGCKFAISAMDFGATAKEAVEYAAKRDPFTGGKITVFDVESGKVVDA